MDTFDLEMEISKSVCPSDTNEMGIEFAHGIVAEIVKRLLTGGLSETTIRNTLIPTAPPHICKRPGNTCIIDSFTNRCIYCAELASG